MSKVREFLPEEIQDIINLYKSGIAITNIVYKYKTGYPNIRRIFNENNINYTEKKQLDDNSPEIINTFYGKIRGYAKNRNIDFNVTINEIWNLYIKQDKKCAMSGAYITIHKVKVAGTASLDRIDSSKGYTIDNVQWVHKDINYMKHVNSVDKFINWCNKVTEYNKPEQDYDAEYF